MEWANSVNVLLTLGRLAFEGVEDAPDIVDVEFIGVDEVFCSCVLSVSVSSIFTASRAAYSYALGLLDVTVCKCVNVHVQVCNCACASVQVCDCACASV